MPWPVHPNGLLGAQGDNDTYQISRSLRFNSADSAYLSRTPASASNRTTWTWSGWVKRGKFDSANQKELFGVYANSTNFSHLYIDTNDTLIFSDYISGVLTSSRITNAIYRDFSSWYHIVFIYETTNATAGDRLKIYVNGVQVTSFSSSTNPTQNYASGLINSTNAHIIGQQNSIYYFDGYLAEINFIDGQALTPSSFGETDAITGRWKAKAYSGTYGTNGFYLKFSDNSSLTTSSNVGIGKDFSGNTNYWATNNLSITAGVGNDSLVDSPTNYGSNSVVGGTVRGNYCTLNPLRSNATGNLISLSNGNLDTSIAAGTNAYFGASGTQAIISGKFYWEVTPTAIGSSAGSWMEIGIIQSPLAYPVGSAIGSYNGGFAYTNDALKARSGSYSAYGATWTTNDVIGVALDADSGSITFYKNGISQGAAYTDLASYNLSAGYYPAIAVYRNTGITQSAVFNFGQRPLAYTAPSGFKALCTTNISTPTIKKPSSYFDAVAYTGTGASNSISSLGFSPDLVWIKNRGGATSHALYDTTRLATKQLSSDTTGDEATSSTGLTAFGSNGFTLGTSTLVNTSGTQYVAWAWDESPQDGFDIVSYIGNGANRTIVHNLGVAPKMLIVKARTTAGADQGWPVWHTSIANTTYLQLNSTSATATGADYWNSTSPTSSVFSVGANAAVNTNADTYIAYCFAEIEGFSKFGSYTGNGSADGPFVYCGFRPRWVLAKGGSEYWYLLDSQRNTSNPATNVLVPNISGAEAAYDSTTIDFLSNGFKIKSNGVGVNASGTTYIFAAFAEQPFKYARAR